MPASPGLMSLICNRNVGWLPDEINLDEPVMSSALPLSSTLCHTASGGGVPTVLQVNVRSSPSGTGSEGLAATPMTVASSAEMDGFVLVGVWQY